MSVSEIGHYRKICVSGECLVEGQRGVDSPIEHLSVIGIRSILETGGFREDLSLHEYILADFGKIINCDIERIEETEVESDVGLRSCFPSQVRNSELILGDTRIRYAVIVSETVSAGISVDGGKITETTSSGDLIISGNTHRTADTELIDNMFHIFHPRFVRDHPADGSRWEETVTILLCKVF